MGLPVASDNLENYNVRKKSLNLIFFKCVFSFLHHSIFLYAVKFLPHGKK